MITVNEEKVEWEEGMTVRRMLQVCRFTFPLVLVKVNGRVIKRKLYDHATIPDEADVQVIHMTAGG